MKNTNSREIEFRIWNLEEKYWCERETFIGLNSSIDSNDGLFVTQQWTGLKDIQGKKIFEGDIISQPVYDGWKFGESKNYVIQWWEYSNHSYYGAGWYAGHNNIDKMAEVVGNIFENPELITENE